MAEPLGSGPGAPLGPPLAPIQEGIWFSQRLSPESPALNVVRCFRVSGDLRHEVLREAWRTLLARHAGLRSVVAEQRGRPFLRVADRSPEPCVEQPRPSRGQAPRTGAERLCERRARTPFDLAQEPPARLHLVASGGAEYLLLFVFHRIAVDDVSVRVLLGEFSEYYTAAVGGGGSGRRLSGPVHDQAFHTLRERAPKADRRSAQPEWWRTQLTPLPGSGLPGRPGPRRDDPLGRADEIRFDWGGGLVPALERFCRDRTLDPVTVLLTAFQVLAGRHHGEDRAVVAVPVRSSPGPGSEQTVGSLTHPLPILADLSAAPPFAEAVRATERALRGALEHQDVPLHRILRGTGVDRVPGNPPLSGAAFLPPTPREPSLHLEGNRVRRLRMDSGSTVCDLVLEVDRTSPTVSGVLRYRRTGYGRPFALRLLSQLRTLLDAGVRDPEAPVDALPLESEEELRSAVRDADRATGVDRPPTAVRPMVEARAGACPDAVAVTDRDGALSYAELDERATALSARLSALGAQGSAVVVRVESGVEHVVALLGVFGAGARVVPVGTGDSGERGRELISELGPVCLITDRDDSEGDPGGLTRWYRAGGGHVVDLRDPGPVRSSTALPSTAAPDECAYVTHTSGSTGRPKGVPQTHGTLAQLVRWMAERFRVGPGSRVAQWAAPTYDASLVETFLALTSGASLHPVPGNVRAHPDQVLTWLSEERITLFQTVPSFARGLVRAITDRGGAPPALDHLLLAGEPLTGELVEALRAALPSTRLVNLYGPTETILATWYDVTDLDAAAGPAPVGRPIPGRQVLVVDQSDRPCPVGVLGEIIVLGPYVTPGYTGSPPGGGPEFRPPASVPLADGWRCYRTGDLGRRRPDGVIEFHGRADSQVKLAGIRTELTEIEDILASHDSVRECAVVPRVNGAGLTSGLTAYVVSALPGPAHGLPAALRAHLRRRLGAAAPPLLLRAVEGPLPRNPGGKVDPRGFASARAADTERERRPLTPMERTVASIWEDLLGTAPAGADDDFLTAGGDSLGLSELVARTERTLGVRLQLRTHYPYASPRTLARLADTRLEEAERSTLTTTEPKARTSDGSSNDSVME